MRRRPALSLLLGACLGLGAGITQTDLYKANEALAAKDLPRAFELYRELAQIGRPQEARLALFQQKQPFNGSIIEF